MTATVLEPPATAGLTVSRPTTLTPASPAPIAEPSPGTWRIDPGRAVVAFSGRRSFVAPTVSARFTGVTGSVAVRSFGAGSNALDAEDVDVEDVDVEVDVTTLSTGNRVWDELLHGLDPFEVNRFPIATYRSRSVRRDGESLHVEGELMLRGVRRAVGLTASYVVGRHGDRMLVRASGTVAVVVRHR